VNKKKIIMISGVAAVSFAGAFLFGLLRSSDKSTQGNEGKPIQQFVAQGAEQQTILPARLPGGTSETAVKALTEKQLKELVYEVRQKIQEYEKKLNGLEKRRYRLETTQQAMKEDIKRLNDLRVELATMVQRLKSERERLLSSIIEVRKTEKENLAALAAAYDRMDSSSAGKILTNMCIEHQEKEGKKIIGGKNTNMSDAVKILYYMGERTKANLLAELVKSEPQLTAVLCENLKRIKEN